MMLHMNGATRRFRLREVQSGPVAMEARINLRTAQDLLHASRETMIKYQTLPEMLDDRARGPGTIVYLEGEGAEKALKLSRPAPARARHPVPPAAHRREARATS